jgi:hypothetical protein
MEEQTSENHTKSIYSIDKIQIPSNAKADCTNIITGLYQVKLETFHIESVFSQFHINKKYHMVRYHKNRTKNFTIVARKCIYMR